MVWAQRKDTVLIGLKTVSRLGWTTSLTYGVAIELCKGGVVDFIMKPPSAKAILETITKALQKG